MIFQVSTTIVHNQLQVIYDLSYVAIGIGPHGHFSLFNDTNVTKIPIEQVLKSEPYLIFYQRADSSSSLLVTEYEAPEVTLFSGDWQAPPIVDRPAQTIQDMNAFMEKALRLMDITQCS